MADRFFPYDVDRRFSLLLAPLLLKPSHGVTITDDTLRATFGMAKIETPLANVVGTSISGPHQWFKAIGLRLSFADDGVTFGTNARRGLCIEFADRIGPVIGPRRHSALWVSVADCDGLADALA
ncbi:MAG: hypothetical protein AB8G26_06355 [Ilumatobacter sp.]